ncbi:MAG: ABC transporter permease [Candidatus Omnitrophica bacterium]|nr:ABC transporter permease [Candidatus Omnitrophota bacterium]
MRYELFLAMRYLVGLKRQQPFVSVIAAISVLGVAVGVAALLVVLGVMSGFDADLEAKIVGANPHLRVEAEGGIADVDSLLKRIEETPGVVAASPYIHAEVLLQQKERGEGVILRGVEPDREKRVTGVADSVVSGRWPPREGEIFLGSELAGRLGVQEGDPISVIVPGKKPTPQSATVGGTFTTGYYDYDLHLALCSLPTVQALLNQPGKISGIGVRVQQAVRAASVKKELRRRLGFPYWVVSWMESNRTLFDALKLEKTAMFILLSLIVLVACFNIIATILMMVVAKTKEIGILKSIGANSRSIRRIFTWAGLLIGVTGTLLGAGIGLSLCAALGKYQFIRLPPEIYYIDRLPVKLEWPDAGAVILAALAISWASCVYPAWVAARLQPAEALRYE